MSRTLSSRRVLATALEHLRALTAEAGDPSGDRCAVDQTAKDAVRLYVDSWITPYVAELKRRARSKR